MRPWRAYKSLEWFIFTGFALAGFFALIAVATLMATARPVVRWHVPLVAPMDTLKITDAARACVADSDCITIPTTCEICNCGDAVNQAYSDQSREKLLRMCPPVTRVTLCEYGCSGYARCMNGRCGLSAAPPVPSTTPLLSDLTGWQTYHNDQRGYSIRYPADWTFAVYSDTNLLFNPIDQTNYTAPDGEPKNAVIVDAAVMDNPQTIESIAQRGRDAGKTVRFLTVAGLPAVQHEDHAYIHTFVISGDVLYMIVYTKGNGGVTGANVYHNMIESFTLTTQADTTFWKTYRNEQYGFEFSYPPGLIVVDINQYRNGTYDLLVSNALGEELTFCEAEPDSARCERIDVDGAVGTITWPPDEYGEAASVEVEHAKPVYLELNLGPGKTPDLFRQILSTFKFTQ